MTNQINPDTLYQSKWTAVSPEHKEKHFMVTTLIYDQNNHVVDVILQAVLTKRAFTLHWRELKNDRTWRTGWQ